MGIAVKALLEDGKQDLVDWTKNVSCQTWCLSILIRGPFFRFSLSLLANASGSLRTRMALHPKTWSRAILPWTIPTEMKLPIEEVRQKKPLRSSPTTVSLDHRELERNSRSVYAVIPYVNYEQADAAIKNPQLKLLFRLLNFAVLAEGKFVCENCQRGLANVSQILRNWSGMFHKQSSHKSYNATLVSSTNIWRAQ